MIYAAYRIFVPVFSVLLLLPGQLPAEEIIFTEGMYRSTYEIIALEKDEDMGLMGIDYLIKNDLDIYYGIGIYGALYGERGGFFTGGIALGYQPALYKDIYADIGFFTGGGGGGAAAQGGGLMLRPHIALLYDTKYFSMGLGYSKVLFPNGDINSDQLYVQVDIPFDKITADVQDHDALNRLLLSHTSDYSFSWNKHCFAATFEHYFPLRDTYDTQGKDEKEITLVGFEYSSYIDRSWFGFFEVAGAMSGGAGGYAEVLGGLGYEQILSDKIKAKAKVSLGSAGGGQVDTGGGVVYKTALGLSYAPLETMNFTTEGGYMGARDGSFKAYTFKLNVAYHLNMLGFEKMSKSSDMLHDVSSGKWSVRIVNQLYYPSETIRYNMNKQAVSLVGLKIDRYLTSGLYLSGQANSAYAGDVGGYASGLIGLGYRTEPIQKISFYFELLGGAGAGGGVASESGALVQPMAGISYKMIKDFDLQVGIGKVRAFEGTLNTVVADIGILYRFYTLEKE